jgi:hypothetical protein
MHAKRLTILLAALLCTLWAPLSRCQESGGTAPAAAPQQTPMQGFEQRFRMIEATAKNNTETWEALNQQYIALRNQATPEEYLLAVARLRKGLETYLAAIEIAGMEQMHFKNQLERYAGNNLLLQQELTLLARYTSQLTLYDKQQADQKAIVEKTLLQLKKYEANLPPPQEFTMKNGMHFRLVPSQRRGSRRTRPFYALDAPVTRAQWSATGVPLPQGGQEEGMESDGKAPVGEITLWQALEFQKAVTRYADGKGRLMLPTAEHAHVLAKDGRWRTLRTAVWLAGKWDEAAGPVEAAHRFHVDWSAIWDPGRCLGGAVSIDSENPGIYPEVPQAAYRQLGCLLVAETDLGIALRAAQVLETMQAEGEAGEAKEADHAE